MICEKETEQYSRADFIWLTTKAAWLAFLLVWHLAGSPASAKVDCDKPTVEPDYRPEDLQKPMRFFYPKRNACLGNAVSNPDLAVGTITEDTPAAFEAYAKANAMGGRYLEFHSPGGNLMAAIKLGELIRANGYVTSLGAVCASACAYALLGGVWRYTVATNFDDPDEFNHDQRFAGASGTKYGVHQFYQKDALSEPVRKAFSAIDRSGDQVIMGLLLDYTLRMGADIRLITLAASVPPWQDMRWLTADEMIAWNVDNTQRRYGELALRAFGAEGSYAETSNTRADETTHLRLFCQNGLREPVLAFVYDVPPTSVPGGGIRSNAAEGVKWLQDVLPYLELSLQFGAAKQEGVPYKVQELTGTPRKDGGTRISLAVLPAKVSRQDMEKLTRVAFTVNGDASRAQWSAADNLRFRIKGDRRLVRLAMNNCVK